MNEQKDVPVRDETERLWRDAFERLEMGKKAEGQKIVWGLVDGFLLYWNQVRTIQGQNILFVDTFEVRMSLTSLTSVYFCGYHMTY